MGTLLVVIGFLLAASGGIWLVVLAFRRSLLWGLACIFLPFAGLVFAILNWREAKKPFLINLAGYPLCFAGFYLSVQGAVLEARHQMQRQPQVVSITSDTPEVHLTENSSGAVAAPEPASAPPPQMSTSRQARRNRSTPNPDATAPLPTRPVRMAALTASEPAASAIVPIEPMAKPATESVKAPPVAASPVTPPIVEFVSLNHDLGEVVRTIKMRITNPSERAVQRIKLTLTYLDASGTKLKEWTTTHQESDPIVGGQANREFDCPAFFMPESTQRVKILLREAGFADGTQWKR